MGISGSALLTGALRARGEYNEGQEQGRAGAAKAQQDALQMALLKRKLEQDEERQRLANALTQAQTGKLLAPPTPEPRNIDPNSKEGIAARLEFEKGKAGLAQPSEPKAPIRGTPEYMKALEAEERLKASLRPQGSGGGNEPLVQVQQPDGSVVWKPRSQAADQQAPRAQGQGGTERQKRIQALANVEDAIKRFENTISTTGTAYIPGTEKSGLQTEYENLQLQLKELFNLGVLNGPDLMLMRRIIDDPTNLTGLAASLGNPKEHTRRTQAQIDKLRGILEGFKKNLAAGNEALAAPPDAAGGGRAGGRGSAQPSGNINLQGASATREQKLWDAAVAKHGEAKVLQMFGPRPK